MYDDVFLHARDELRKCGNVVEERLLDDVTAEDDPTRPLPTLVAASSHLTKVLTYDATAVPLVARKPGRQRRWRLCQQCSMIRGAAGNRPLIRCLILAMKPPNNKRDRSSCRRRPRICSRRRKRTSTRCSPRRPISSARTSLGASARRSCPPSLALEVSDLATHIQPPDGVRPHSRALGADSVLHRQRCTAETERCSRSVARPRANESTPLRASRTQPRLSLSPVRNGCVGTDLCVAVLDGNLG